MTRAWLHPIPGAAPVTGAIAAAIPVLETTRLILRAPAATDWPVLEPIWTTDRSRFIGGPYTGETAWLDFCQAIAGWILRGVSDWTVTRRDDAAVLGLVGIFADFGDPEPELGWLLTEDAEGQGYATEAARAVHDYAFGTLGMKTIVSYIDTGHTASIAIAERLSAKRDEGPNAFGDSLAIYRHTAPEPRQ